jgi:hypothetical protein
VWGTFEAASSSFFKQEKTFPSKDRKKQKRVFSIRRNRSENNHWNPSVSFLSLS